MPLFENSFIAVFTIVLAFIFGTVLASFITCTAGRVLAHEDWTHGYSHCDTCNHKLGALDLFPVISYLALGGKCRYCGAKVPIRCLISEVLLGVVFALTVVIHGSIDIVMARNLALAMLMMGISFCDIDGAVVHSGFTTAIMSVWIGTAAFVPDMRLYVIDGVIAVILCCGIPALIDAGRESKNIPLIRLIAVYLLYTGLIAGALFLLLTFIIRSIYKAAGKKISDVAVLSVCTLFCLVISERLWGCGLHFYISALSDLIRTF